MHKTKVKALLPALSIAPLLKKKEFAEALEVRRVCYTKRGKIQPSSKPELPEHEMKRPGTLYGIYAGARIVGCVRMLAPKSADLLESVDIPLGRYPGDLPAKTDSIEITGLCLLPEFRGIETFKLIYAQVHRFLVEHNRGHIIISADQVLKKKYRFIGFTATGHCYDKPASAFPHICIMVSNQRRFGIYGLHADPLRWNLFLRDITDELKAEKKIRHPLAVRALFGFYKTFALPSRLLDTAIQRKLIRA